MPASTTRTDNQTSPDVFLHAGYRRPGYAPLVSDRGPGSHNPKGPQRSPNPKPATGDNKHKRETRKGCPPTRTPSNESTRQRNADGLRPLRCHRPRRQRQCRLRFTGCTKRAPNHRAGRYFFIRTGVFDRWHVVTMGAPSAPKNTDNDHQLDDAEQQHRPQHTSGDHPQCAIQAPVLLSSTTPEDPHSEGNDGAHNHIQGSSPHKSPFAPFPHNNHPGLG
jgi:hypothetical protein